MNGGGVSIATEPAMRGIGLGVLSGGAGNSAGQDKVVRGSKTMTFARAVEVPLHLPLSGRTISLDAAGRCKAGG